MSHPPTGSTGWTSTPSTPAPLAPRQCRPHRFRTRRILPLGLAALLLASLLPLVTSAAATAARASTTVSGWSSTPITLASGEGFRARVVVTGGARAVHLQRKVGTTWRTVDRGRSSSDGRVALSWVAPSTGTVLLRIRVPATPTHAAKVTSARRVDVRASADAATLDTVLSLVNEVRSQAQTCGGVHYPAVPALQRDARLDRAADDFAHLMAEEDFFDHRSPDGSDPGDRITGAGYRWRSYGENIAAGYAGAAAVVQGWLDSPGHCKNLMGRFAEVGLGYAVDSTSTYGTYWVQDFATAQ